MRSVVKLPFVTGRAISFSYNGGECAAGSNEPASERMSDDAFTEPGASGLLQPGYLPWRAGKTKSLPTHG